MKQTIIGKNVNFIFYLIRDNIYSQISSVAMGYGMSSDIIEVIQGKLEKQIADSE